MYRFQLKMVAIATMASFVALGNPGKVLADSGQPERLKDFLSASAAGQERMQRVIQTEIAGCMKRQGFDYDVAQPSALLKQVAADSAGSQDAFQRKYGYLISTAIDVESPGVALGLEDPNSRRISRLPAAERKAYLTVLVGKKAANGAATPPAKGEGGCSEEAVTKVFGSTDALTALQTELGKLGARVEADPRIRPLMTKWRTCMAKSGFTYLNTDAAQQYLTKKLQGILAAAPPPDPKSVEPYRFPSDTKKAIRAIQTEELKIARTDVACTNSEMPGVDKILADIEQDVIAKYRTPLEQIRNATKSTPTTKKK